MRFLTLVKMNNNVVSKGYGPNKRESKSQAVHALLRIICPNIYEQWKEKIKTYQFNINPNDICRQQQAELERIKAMTQPPPLDEEMVIDCSEHSSPDKSLRVIEYQSINNENMSPYLPSNRALGSVHNSDNKS